MGTLLGIIMITIGGLMGLWAVGIVIAGAIGLAVLAVKVAVPVVLIYAGYRLVRGNQAAY